MQEGAAQQWLSDKVVLASSSLFMSRIFGSAESFCWRSALIRKLEVKFPPPLFFRCMCWGRGQGEDE